MPDLFRSATKSVMEPVGTGTRSAIPCSLPLSSGSTSPTARAETRPGPHDHGHELPGHKHEPTPEVREQPATGHGLFLGWAIRAFYFGNQRSLAGAYYEHLRKLVKKNPGEAPVPLKPAAPLEEFILTSLISAEAVGKPAASRPVIENLLLRAVREGYAAGQDESAGLYLSIARKIHSACPPSSGKDAGRTAAAGSLPPFDDLLDGVFTRYLLNPDGTSPPPLSRANAWKSAPPELKARVYERVRGPLQAEMNALGLDAAVAFPPPAAR